MTLIAEVMAALIVWVILRASRERVYEKSGLHR